MYVRGRSASTRPPGCGFIARDGKERLWLETLSLLGSLLRRQPRADDEPIFVNRYGAPPTGVRFKLPEYIKAAAELVPSLTLKHVTPHLCAITPPWLASFGTKEEIPPNMLAIN